tara:strand:+ start:1851 stop:2297 length:447 start_codon:yes stop_codon:yes gene_type:complete
MDILALWQGLNWIKADLEIGWLIIVVISVAVVSIQCTANHCKASAMNTLSIVKTELTKILQDWGQGRMSATDLQDWMVTHYDPGEIEVGPGESKWTVAAMNIVMNEYEIAKPIKYLQENYTLATAFIHCSEGAFEAAKTRFIRQAFVD